MNWMKAINRARAVHENDPWATFHIDKGKAEICIRHTDSLSSEASLPLSLRSIFSSSNNVIGKRKISPSLLTEDDRDIVTNEKLT
jgi:hypothetical protein